MQSHKPRREIAYVSILGTTQMHLRNPWIIAWWSASIPGFGHLLLSKYLRAFVLISWEMLINSQAKINLAMMYSFTGRFELAKHTLDIRWMSLYAPVYLFAIYDSYRTTVDLNNMYVLANREKAPFAIFRIQPMEIYYLDKRTPWVASVWSTLMPGLGQLYIHRIIASFFVLTVWIGIIYKSHYLEAVQYTLLGEFSKVVPVINAQWLLFLPSIYSFAIYDAYVNTVENNKLFDKEQAHFLKENYQSAFDMPMMK